MNPTGKCFVSGPRGYFSFEPDFTLDRKMKLLGVFSGFYELSEVFDAAGRAWRVEELQCRYRKSWWLTALVHTVFNPWVDVSFSWREPAEYRIKDLKTAYSNSVDQDDDILTQFVEAAELKSKIAAAESFEDLVRVYEWMKTDHSDEK